MVDIGLSVNRPKSDIEQEIQTARKHLRLNELALRQACLSTVIQCILPQEVKSGSQDEIDQQNRQEEVSNRA